MGNNSARSLIVALILLMRPFTVDFAINSVKVFLSNMIQEVISERVSQSAVLATTPLQSWCRQAVSK